MFIGVTEGFRYKMRLVHAHFPITAKPTNKENNVIVVKNFLGGKKDHVIPLHKGTTVQLSKEVKDELIFDGVDNAMDNHSEISEELHHPDDSNDPHEPQYPQDLPPIPILGYRQKSLEQDDETQQAEDASRDGI